MTEFLFNLITALLILTVGIYIVITPVALAIIVGQWLWDIFKDKRRR